MSSFHQMIRRTAARASAIVQKTFQNTDAITSELFTDIFDADIPPELEESFQALLDRRIHAIEERQRRQVRKFKQMPEAFEPPAKISTPAKDAELNELLEAATTSPFESAALAAEMGEVSDNRGFANFVKSQPFYRKTKAYERWGHFKRQLQSLLA